MAEAIGAGSGSGATGFVLRALRSRGAVDVLLPGLYAWAVTTAAPGFSRLAPWPARISAGLAPLALVLGVLVESAHLRRGKSFGIWAFAALCVGTWASVPSSLVSGSLDPVQAAFGSIGWTLFALGWGAASRTSSGDLPPAHERDNSSAPAGMAFPDESAASLSPRARLAPGALPIVFAGTVGAALVLFQAWWVADQERGLFAQGVALASAVAIVSVAGVVATERGKWRPPRSPAGRLRSVALTLILVVVFGALGALSGWLR